VAGRNLIELEELRRRVRDLEVHVKELWESERDIWAEISKIRSMIQEVTGMFMWKVANDLSEKKESTK